MYSRVTYNKELYWAIQNWNLRQSKQGYIPVVGSKEGIYRHLAGEGWASDISWLRTWGWNGPHHVCTSHTPVTQVGYTMVFINADWEKKIVILVHFMCLDINMRVNSVLFFAG